MGEHIDWALLRPDMAAGMGQLSAAVYGNSELSVREREAARWTIALINDCAVCRDTRARDGEAVGAGEPFYAEVTDWRAATELSTRERLAAEFAERFAIDHLAMDDELWGRLHEAFSEAELADLTICCGCFLGMGRTLAAVSYTHLRSFDMFVKGSVGQGLDLLAHGNLLVTGSNADPPGSVPGYSPRSSSQRSASMAAMQPDPAEVMAWR